MWTRIRSFGCLGVLLLGCGTAAQTAHVGEDALRDPRGRWAVYFPAPPWERVEVTPTGAVLRVPAPQGTLVMGGLPGARLGAVVEERSGTTARPWIEGAVRASVGRGAVLTRAVTERPVAGGRVLTATLDEGAGGHLLAAADLPGGGALTLEVRALRSVTDDPDLAALVGSMELQGRAP